MGLELDFNDIDLGGVDAINHDSADIANFGLYNFHFNNDLGSCVINNGLVYDSAGLSHSSLPLPPKLTNEESDTLALQVYEASNPGTSTHQEPVHSIEMRVQKRKKMDEVDKGRILPEGSRRKRNQTARARGLTNSLA